MSNAKEELKMLLNGAGCKCNGKCKKCQTDGVANQLRKLLKNDANFASESQRKYMWSQHPDIAEDWAHGEHSSEGDDHKMPEETGSDVRGPMAKKARKQKEENCAMNSISAEAMRLTVNALYKQVKSSPSDAAWAHEKASLAHLEATKVDNVEWAAWHAACRSDHRRLADAIRERRPLITNTRLLGIAVNGVMNAKGGAKHDKSSGQFTSGGKSSSGGDGGSGGAPDSEEDYKKQKEQEAVQRMMAAGAYNAADDSGELASGTTAGGNMAATDDESAGDVGSLTTMNEDEDGEIKFCPIDGTELEDGECPDCGWSMTDNAAVGQPRHESGRFLSIGAGTGKGPVHSAAVSGSQHGSYPPPPGLKRPVYQADQPEDAEDELHEDDAPAQIVGRQATPDGRNIADITRRKGQVGDDDDAGHSSEGNEAMSDKSKATRNDAGRHVVSTQTDQCPKCGNPMFDGKCECGYTAPVKNAFPPQQQGPPPMDPHEATKAAAGQTLQSEHAGAMPFALKAMKHSGNDNSEKASDAHLAAAGQHDDAALQSRKDGDPNEAAMHDNAAAAHRTAASCHQAGMDDGTQNRRGSTMKIDYAKLGRHVANELPADQLAAWKMKEDGRYDAEEGGHASAEAHAASAHANKTGSEGAHRKAAAADKAAAEHHREEGNTEMAKKHTDRGRSHTQKANAIARAKKSQTGNMLLSINALSRPDLIQILTNGLGQQEATVISQLPDQTLRSLVANADGSFGRFDSKGGTFKTTWDQAGGEGESDEYDERGVKVGQKSPIDDDPHDDDNEDDGDKPDDWDQDDIDEGGKDVKNQRMLNRLMQQDPVFRSIYQDGVRNRRQEMTTLLRRLTSNIRDPQRKKLVANQLAKKDIGELRLMVECMGNQRPTRNHAPQPIINADLGQEIVNSPTFLGAAGGGVVSNASSDGLSLDSESLVMPTMNYLKDPEGNDIPPANVKASNFYRNQQRRMVNQGQ